MKQIIFGNWNFMRFLRLGLGIAIIVHSLTVSNWMMVILGIGFTALPILNIGCCGTAGCTTDVKAATNAKKDSGYEEVV